VAGWGERGLTNVPIETPGRSPLHRLLFRNAIVKTAKPLQAADLAFAEWEQLLMPPEVWFWPGGFACPVVLADFPSLAREPVLTSNPRFLRSFEWRITASLSGLARSSTGRCRRRDAERSGDLILGGPTV